MSSPDSRSPERLARKYCFGDFTLDLDAGFLWRAGDEVTLRPKVFELLAYLVQHHGRLVTKAELIEAVWQDTAVTDNSLAQCVVELRRALGDDTQQLIRTVARRGYLFTAPVSRPGIQFPLAPVAARDTRLPPRRLWRAAWLGGAGCICAVVWLGSAYIPGRSPAKLNIPASIAVLPFINADSGSDSEHLGDAISEDITNTLSRIPQLRVVARSSALRFRGGNADIHDIGRQLGVATVLEGSVRRSGARLRITAELVNTSDRYLVWSETYDRSTDDILDTQSAIAQAVAVHLKLPAGSIAQRGRRTRSLDAYNLVIQGRYANAGPRNSEARMTCYRRALEYDPEYADAWAALAGEWLRGVANGSVSPRPVMGQAKDALAKALQFDDTLPDAHFLSAMVKWTYDWDWPGADREFIAALQLDPNSAAIRVQYARYLALMGRRQAALSQLESIRVLDPLSAESRSTEAAVSYFTGDYDRAIQHAEAVLSGAPELWPMYFWLGRAYDTKGRLSEAITALEKSNRVPGQLQGRGFGMLASCYARAGRKADALRLLESALALSRETHVSPVSIAVIYIGLNDHGRALDWFEKAYQERDHSLVALKADPAYDSLRENPKFVALLRRMKLD